MDNSYSLIDTDCIPQRDTENDFSEWFEDAPNDAEWFENLSSINADSTACSLVDESNSLLNELYEKNKVLEQQWTETDLKYQNVLTENQNLNIQLTDERHRANKYYKKLQYIQENYHIFNHIKQAYLNMKYNENIDKPMIEIKEEASQTCPGILCASCVKITKQPTTVTSSDPDVITVKKSDLAKMHETLQQLKDKIDEREKSWSYNEEKENKYVESITQLQNHVKQLHEEITEKRSVIESIKSIDSNTDMIQRENLLLRKVIVKLDHRQRELEKLYKPEKRMPLLNQNEKTIVQQLVKKYAQHHRKYKSQSNITSQKTKVLWDGDASLWNYTDSHSKSQSLHTSIKKSHNQSHAKPKPVVFCLYAHKLDHKSKRNISIIDAANVVPLVPPPSSTQRSQSPTQHTGVMNIGEVIDSIPKNGAGEGCSGILSVPNKYLQSTLIGDYKEQAEKPLDPKTKVEIIECFEDCL